MVGQTTVTKGQCYDPCVVTLVQLWSAYSDCGAQYRDAVTKGMQLVDLIKRFVHKYRDVFRFVTTADGWPPLLHSA